MPDAFTAEQRQRAEVLAECAEAACSIALTQKQDETWREVRDVVRDLLAAHDALVVHLAQVTAERDALAHGDSLVCAAAARGVTDCSTPAHIRVQNIVTELERAEARIAHLEAERDAPATPDEPPVTRCDGCGYQWPGPWPPAHLCGDCWRKAQPVLHAPAPVEPSWAQRFAAMSHNDRLMTIAEDGSTLVALIQEALHGPAGGALGGQTVPSESTGILIGDVVMFGGRMEPPRFQ